MPFALALIELLGFIDLLYLLEVFGRLVVLCLLEVMLAGGLGLFEILHIMEFLCASKRHSREAAWPSS